MRIALFDLDFTLIDFDSGLAWLDHLVARGVLPAGAAQAHLQTCQAYVDGKVDVKAVHRGTVLPLRSLPIDTVRSLAEDFADALAPRFSAASKSLVQAHLDAGDLCAVVTATSQFIAEPLARRFGIAHVVATRSSIVGGPLSGHLTRGQLGGPVSGHLSGDSDGPPCHGPHKLTHLTQWLASRGQALEGFERSTFYSDAASDLPLLEAVTNPVAVRPDARLRQVALERGWPIA